MQFCRDGWQDIAVINVFFSDSQFSSKPLPLYPSSNLVNGVQFNSSRVNSPNSNPCYNAEQLNVLAQ